MDEIRNKIYDLAYDHLQESAIAAGTDKIMLLIQQEIAKARQQGWHEGRAAANNPDIQYGYSPDGQTLKESEK